MNTPHQTQHNGGEMSNELATTNTVGEMSIPAMMQAIIEQGMKPENVTVLEKLMAMKERQDHRNAQAAFNQDFLALRKECRPIAATRVIPTKDGGVKGRFASLEDIVVEVTPLLEKYGFSDTYSQQIVEGGRTKVTVTLLHTSGHERSSEYTCREHASPLNSPAQNDGGTNKMARRHALCNMLGIVLDYSPDARLEGDTILEHEAVELERRVMSASNGDDAQAKRYLRLADALTFAEVRRAKYAVVCAQLDRDEAKSKAPAKSPKATLAELVSNWSGVGKEDLGKAVGDVFAAAKINTGGKATDDQCKTAIDWIELNNHKDFFDAVRTK